MCEFYSPFESMLLKFIRGEEPLKPALRAHEVGVEVVGLLTTARLMQTLVVTS